MKLCIYWSSLYKRSGHCTIISYYVYTPRTRCDVLAGSYVRLYEKFLGEYAQQIDRDSSHFARASLISLSSSSGLYLLLRIKYLALCTFRLTSMQAYRTAAPRTTHPPCQPILPPRSASPASISRLLSYASSKRDCLRVSGFGAGFNDCWFDLRVPLLSRRVSFRLL